LFPAHAIGIEWGLLTLVIVLPVVAWPARRERPARIAMLLAAATYLVVLLSLTFLPLPLSTEAASYPPKGYPWFNVDPFFTIGRALRRGLASHDGLILIGNLLAFVPVGVLLPILRPSRWQWLTVLLAAATLSVLIELGQFGVSRLIGAPYRQADIDDVLVNAAGGLIGYVSLVVIGRLPARKHAPSAKRE
jgi:glycopeptide antibiotics resistance protein